MKKRLFSLLVMVCLVGGAMCGCAAKEKITSQQAIAVMLNDLGEDAKNASNPHVHTGTYKNQDCYSIYVTINEESWVYIVSMEGEVLTKGLSSHTH